MMKFRVFFLVVRARIVSFKGSLQHIQAERRARCVEIDGIRYGCQCIDFEI